MDQPVPNNQKRVETCQTSHGLNEYPANVPAEIDMNEFHSVVDVINKSCEEYADKSAYVNFGAELTYRQVDEYSRAFGARMQALGLEKGDRIAIMMPNVLQYPIAVFGALRAGLVVVNTNPLYTARELKHQLKDSGARAIVIMENFANVLEAVIDDTEVEHVMLTSIGDMVGFPKGMIMNFVLRHIKKMVPKYNLPEAMASSRSWPRAPAKSSSRSELGHDDLAFLQYTGGTTGVSKGAMLTHGNMVANMQQASAWLGDRSSARPRNHRDRPAALPHLRPDRELPGLHEVRRAQCADHQPARHAGFVKELGEGALHRDYRGQHPVQRPAQHARDLPTWISPTCA
jgi:long-chain acyl-CoA synthetase